MSLLNHIRSRNGLFTIDFTTWNFQVGRRRIAIANTVLPSRRVTSNYSCLHPLASRIEMVPRHNILLGQFSSGLNSYRPLSIIKDHRHRASSFIIFLLGPAISQTYL